MNNMNNNRRHIEQCNSSKICCSCGSICSMQCEEKGKFTSIAYSIKLSSQGKASILFDSADCLNFTISVVNISNSSMQGHLELSPDGCYFITDRCNSLKMIEPCKLEIFLGVIFIRYTAIVLVGKPCSEAMVYIQSQNL